MDDKSKEKVTLADLANQKQSQSSAAEIQEAAALSSTPISEPENLFFNVMPKVKDAGGVVKATLKIEQTKDEAPAKNEFLEKNKRYIIIGISIIILGLAVYFIMAKIGSNSYKPENLLVQQPTHPKSSTTTTQSSASISNFTTPQSWRDKYWPNCTDPTECGDNADPDLDGLTNLQEYKLGTDPNNPDSDDDGLSDGDEVNVFDTNPLNAHSSGDSQYTDSDYFKGGYDVSTGKKMTAEQIAQITAKMQTFGLHEPTLTTLQKVLNSIYNFSPHAASSSGSNATSSPQGSASSTPNTASSTSVSGLDESLKGKQDRDTQRSDTIENIEAALVKYKADNPTYPQTNDFGTMYAEVKIYLKVATDPVDPINQPPYVYSYVSNASGMDFSLTFYSEVAGQVIAKNAADAQKDTTQQQASIYDNQRETDLENIHSALLLYSQANVAGNQTYVFPTVAKYETALVPTYLEAIPKDPETAKDYQYQVSNTFDTFTLKTPLDNPPTGTTGYECNQDSCQNY